MTEQEARTRLESMVSAESEPELDVAEIEALVQLSKRADSEGVAPSDDDWVPTFDLNAGAAEGWRWKAGKSVPRFDITLDGAAMQRQQIYAHCMSQAQDYANKLVGSIAVRSVTEFAEAESFQ